MSAVFGAVIVVAGLLTLGGLITTTESVEASQVPSTLPGGSGGGDGESADDRGDSTFGDLPPSATSTTTTTAPPPSTDPGEPSDPDDAPGGGLDEPEEGLLDRFGDGSGSDVETLPCPDGVDPVICDAAEFVQQVRGRPFQTFPEVELLPDAEFDRALLSDFDLYVDAIEADDATLTALGLIGPDVSLVEVERGALEAGVVGFYDPSTGQTVVRGNDLSLYAQLVLVHELVHAFDDQWFDLDRGGPDAEADYGFSAVIEGNASRVENLWRSQLSPSDQALLAEQERTALSEEDIDRLLAIPPALQTIQSSPYFDGEVYVDEIVAEGGEAAVDAALIDPPTSSEEILHPDVDRSVEAEIPIPLPAAEGPVVDDGRLGELMIQQWLGRLAADGWGGDRYTTFTLDGQQCILVDLVGDDAVETAEIVDAATAWAERSPTQRTATETTIAGRAGIRVRACV